MKTEFFYASLHLIKNPKYNLCGMKKEIRSSKYPHYNSNNPSRHKNIIIDLIDQDIKLSDPEHRVKTIKKQKTP